MQIKKIYSNNADFQKLEVLKSNRNKRHRYGEFFVEGVRNINQAIQYGWQISAFIYSIEDKRSLWANEIIQSVPADEHLQLTDALMKEISGKTDTSELLAVVKMRPDTPEIFYTSENPVIVLFDRPSNKGNLGTVIRSADAFGTSGLIVTGHAVDLYDPEVVAATMGSLFALPCIRMQDTDAVEGYLQQLKLQYPGLLVVGSTAHQETPLHSINFEGPVVVLVGNETEGLSRRLKGLCDVLATIPMSSASSASSLNVSCAATVLLYEVMRGKIR